MKTIASPYHDTLAETVAAALNAATDARAARAVLANPFEFEAALSRDHLPYGTTRSADGAIGTLKGKPTRKYFHATITRLDSGRYELVTYVL